MRCGGFIVFYYSVTVNKIDKKLFDKLYNLTGVNFYKFNKIYIHLQFNVEFL